MPLLRFLQQLWHGKLARATQPALYKSPATPPSAARASATSQAASSADIFPDSEFPVLDSPFPPYAPDSAEWVRVLNG